jgi:hypothetical protein
MRGERVVGREEKRDKRKESRGVGGGDGSRYSRGEIKGGRKGRWEEVKRR